MRSDAGLTGQTLRRPPGYPPQVSPSLVSRPRLFARLDTEAPLTVVRAPIGFGKSTLVSQWLSRRREDGTTVAWMTVENHECPVDRFWETVYDALVLAGLSFQSSGVRSARGAVVEAAWGWRHPLLLVLDSYERADDDVDHALVELVRQCPNMRVVACTRTRRGFEEPDRCDLEIAVLRTRDLALNEVETRDLLAGVGLSLPPHRSAPLPPDTGGWPALLQLVAVTLQAATGHVDDRTVTRRAALTFLRQRVLPAVTEPALVRHLWAFALPASLTADVARLCSGGAQGETLLAQFEAHGLLVAEMVDGERVYRWPALLREVLCAQYERDQPELGRELHGKLARWYRDADVPHEAVRHAAQVDDWELAGAVIETHWRWLVRRHRDVLEAAFARMPGAILASLPRARLIYEVQFQLPAGATTSTISTAAISAGLNAFFQAADVRDQLDTGLAVLVALRRRGDLARATELATELTRRWRTAGIVDAARIVDLVASVCLQVGIAHLLTGDRARSDEALALAYRLADACPYPGIATDAAGRLALNAALTGDLAGARTWLARVDEGPSPRSAWLAPLELLGGRVARLLIALDSLDRAAIDRAWETLVHGYALPDEQWAFAMYAYAQHALMHGDKLDALSRLTDYRASHARWIGEHAVARSLLEGTEADLLLALGRADQARRVLERAEGAHPFLLTARARLALLTGEYDAADSLAHQGIWNRATWRRTRVDLLLLQAAARHRQRRRGEAIGSLTEAVRVSGGASGLMRGFALTSRRMLRDLSADVPQVPEILDALCRHDAAAAFPDELATATLTNREQLVLEHVAEGLTLGQISKHLYVSVNTVKTQLRSVYRKLEVGSRDEAVRQGRQLGLLDER